MYDWKRDSYELRYGNGKLRIAENEYPNIDDFADCWLEVFKDKPNYKQFYKKQNLFGYLLSNVISLWSHNDDNDVELNAFVASVLKKGFYWNSKFLSYGEFVDEGILNGYQIAIDENSMGWIVNMGNGQIKGEVWKLSKNELRDIEYFYGFCQKENVTITIKNCLLNDVVCFVRKEPITENEKIVEQYTLKNQKDYNSMAHSIKLEERYMNKSFKFALPEI